MPDDFAGRNPRRLIQSAAPVPSHSPESPASGEPLPEEHQTAVLLGRVRLGDREALDRLLELHMPRLRRWATGRLPRWARDAADTSDLVQDTVIHALRHLESFQPRGPGALQAYLRQAIVNRIRNALRSAAGRPVPATLDPRIPDPGPSPLEEAIGAETLDRYDGALQRLSADERDALVGRIEIGLTYGELAHAMGRPSADAARMLVVRAVVKLAKEMNHPDSAGSAGPA